MIVDRRTLRCSSHYQTHENHSDEIDVDVILAMSF